MNDMVDWVKEATVSIKVDPRDENFSDLEGLARVFKNVKVVLLGEQFHGDGTCFETKIRLVKFLHQKMGFDVLAFESGIYDCTVAWEMFKGGAESLEAAKKGILEDWRNSKQMLELWQYLSKYSNTKTPLELSGFDCQLTGFEIDDRLQVDLVQLFFELGIDRESKLVKYVLRTFNYETLMRNKGGDIDDVCRVY